MSDVSRLRLVIFRVGELTCAVPAGLVREVLAHQPATRIPGAHDAVDGLINVRGTLLTVFDAHRALEHEKGQAEESSILVLDGHNRALGLVVDEVLDLVEVATDSLDPREALPGVDPRLAKAVGREGRWVFVLLDTDALLAPLLG